MDKKEKIKNNMNNIHDKSYKDLYSKREVALDLFKNISNAKWVKDLKAEDLTLSNSHYITADYEEKEADIVYKANINNNEVVFYILLEFQSSVDYTMPLRLLFYMCEILKEHAVNAKYKKYNKNIKIPAVIPIVLYNGEKVWDVPKQFRKMIYNENLFGNNILNFEYDVFDINNDKKLTKEKLIDLKNVTAAIFLLDQKMDAMEFLERIKVIALYFNSLNDTEIKAIKKWIKNTVVNPLAESAIKILESKREDVELMVARNAFILDEMKEKAEREGMAKGIEQGIKQGIEKGIRQGIEQGIQQGIQQGIEQGKRQIIQKMLLKGVKSEDISEMLEIDINIVNNIKKNV